MLFTCDGISRSIGGIFIQTQTKHSQAASPRSIGIQVAQFIQATAEGMAAIRLPERRTAEHTFVGYRTTSW